MYRKLVNRYGKVKVWNCSNDELLELVDEYLEEVLCETGDD